MQDIVIESLNDLEFLKVALKTEIDEINIRLESLKGFKTVQKYIALTKIEGNIKGNDISNNKVKIKNAIDNLVTEFIEVKQYIESIKALQEYEEDLTNLDNLVSINGVIYNKEREDKIYYSAKEVLKYLINLKQSKGITSKLTTEELNRYIDAVRKSLQDNTHYEDDKVIDEILSFKVYQNPQNYDIKNVRELPSLDLEYQYEIDNLTEREKEAFFGTEACKALGTSKEQDKVKRIGAKKNV